jgi:hypothetical protein
MTLEPNANEPGERERAAERERQAEAERRMLEEMAAEAAAKEPDAPSEQPAERRRGIGGIGNSGLPEQRGLSSRMRGSPPELTDYAASLGGDDRPINVDPAVQFAQSPKLEVGPTTGTGLTSGANPAAGDNPQEQEPVESAPDWANKEGAVGVGGSSAIRAAEALASGSGGQTEGAPGATRPGGEAEPATVDRSGQHVSALRFMEPDPSVQRPQTGGGQQQAAVDTGPVVVAGHNPNQTRTRPRTLVLGIEKGNGEEQGEAMAIPGGGAP